MRVTVALQWIAFLVLAACATREPLVPRSASVPEGIDLSGRWQLADASMEQIPSTETIVHVFLESGKDLKVTQADTGLFISFDRSVVEDYAFGENREVNVGPIVAERVSGWEDRSYVIETRDSDGLTLLETYRLSDDGGKLQRTISIQKGSNRELDWRQTFVHQ